MGMPTVIALRASVSPIGWCDRASTALLLLPSIFHGELKSHQFGQPLDELGRNFLLLTQKFKAIFVCPDNVGFICQIIGPFQDCQNDDCIEFDLVGRPPNSAGW